MNNNRKLTNKNREAMGNSRKPSSNSRKPSSNSRKPSSNSSKPSNNNRKLINNNWKLLSSNWKLMNNNRKLKIIRKGLSLNPLYTLGRAGISLGIKGYMRTALIYLLEETRAAYRRERPVVWCSTFVPSELIYAMGGVPFLPEVASGLAATLGLADEVLLEAEKNWMNADLCSVHRCGAGLLLKGVVPEPDLIIASTHLCDGARKYLYYISRHYDCPYYLLETPYNMSEADWLAAGLEEMVEDINPVRLDFDRVFALSNQAYHYHKRVNQLRRALPAVHSGEHAMNMVPLEFMCFGSEGGAGYYRELAAALEKRVLTGEGVIEEEKHRLLWLHLKPYYSQGIFTCLREMGAVIAFEEYSQLYWELLDPAAPYQSLARKMINHFGWGPLERQLAGILQLVEDYRLDGVIGFSQWGCRQNSGRMNLFKRGLKERDIPFLNLEGDLVDSRNYREGQLKTRLQAFIELLENRPYRKTRDRKDDREKQRHEGDNRD